MKFKVLCPRHSPAERETVGSFDALVLLWRRAGTGSTVMCLRELDVVCPYRSFPKHPAKLFRTVLPCCSSGSKAAGKLPDLSARKKVHCMKSSGPEGKEIYSVPAIICCFCLHCALPWLHALRLAAAPGLPCIGIVRSRRSPGLTRAS